MFLIVIMNIPFGYWRGNVRKFSLQWFLSIHIPVIIEIVLRICAGISLVVFTFLLFAGSFIVGQIIGKLLYIWFRNRSKSHITSCIFYDIYKEISK